MTPEQQQPKADEPEEETSLSEQELAAKKQQDEWRNAYIEQQRRMHCQRGGCGEGNEIF